MPGYLTNTLTPAEREALEVWMAASDTNRKAVESLLNEDQALAEWRMMEKYRLKKPEKVKAILPVPVRNRQIWWAQAAAVALVVIGSTTAIWVNNTKPATVPVAAIEEVLPGSTKAKLVLPNGETLSLDESSDTAFMQGQAVQVQQHQGNLAYEQLTGETDEVIYHKLITPKGGEFKVRLEDGTLVWLNAASSIRYPTKFTGSTRTVQVTGEAYFEIAKDAEHPFIVEVNDFTAIEVLGTHFNVNAYTDQDHIYTTLLQGAVAVTAGAEKRRLSPGQQAIVNHQPNSPVNVQAADTIRAVAWKNGEFDFNDAKLSDVMRQLSKWYDVTITYEPGAPDIKIWGRMKRNQNLQQVVAILNAMDVKVRLEEGRKLSVLR